MGGSAPPLDTRIKAVGIATGTAQTSPKPDFGNAGLNWSKEGWFVPVYYATLTGLTKRSTACSTLSASQTTSSLRNGAPWLTSSSQGPSTDAWLAQ
jgi:hypothetical protein